MKKLLVHILLVIVGLCLNFGLFLYSYKKLAFPYIHEAQRIENAPYIFSYVLAGFILISVFCVLLTFVANRSIKAT